MIEHYQHIPVARYEDNLSIVEAYNDVELQPVVVMKRLDDARYFSTVIFLLCDIIAVKIYLDCYFLFHYIVLWAYTEERVSSIDSALITCLTEGSRS